MKPIYYMQSNSKWGKLPFTSTNNPKQTIASSGCGTTCAAMVLATLLNDATILPDFTAKLCVNNGFRTVNDGTDFKFFPFIAKKYGLELIECYKTDEAVKHLQEGALVICSMTGIKDSKGNVIASGYFTKGGHFILAYDVKDGNIIVNDPNSTIRTKASIEIFKQQCQKYFIFTKAEVKTMNWKEILEKVSEQSPDWEKAITTAQNVAIADGNLGDLEIFKYLPQLIEKVYEMSPKK